MLKKYKNLTINLPRKNDLYTYEEILGKINQYNLELFLPYLKKEDIVIDLGAHIGLFSLAVAQYVNKVIAIEPDIENFEILKHNISSNNLLNITTINKAVSNKGKKIDFYKSHKTPARHSLYKNKFFNNNGLFSQKLEVKAISLPAILSSFEKCKLLKVDIEGAEYDIFFNCSKNVLKKINFFLIEYHNLSDKLNGKALEKFFKDLNFTTALGKEVDIKDSDTSITVGNLLVINPN
ncbi:MAG: FkbM family methyltransferase [Parachlamydiales bacterium]|nr:FkbM family methyltransferase [Parachlamydiales bacterium]